MAAKPEMIELVPEPASGRVFEGAITPGAADVVGSGRSRLDAIARWLQEIAREDLDDAGFGGRGVWIVRRTRISVSVFPRYGEQLELRTFCSGIGRFSAERRTSIRGDGGGRVETVSSWICFDLEGRRPQRFDEDFRLAYAEAAGGREAKFRVRHPDPPADASGEPWVFRATDLDVAGHVNNSHYWAPIEQDLLAAGAEPPPFDGEVEHREPAGAGEAVLLRGDGIGWVTSQAGEIHASLLASV